MTIIKKELDDSVYKCSLMLITMLKYVCPDAKVSYDTQAQVATFKVRQTYFMSVATDSSWNLFFVILQTKTRAFRERKPPPMPKFEIKVIHDSNPDFRINPDLNVRRIYPKMLWMHYLVSISHFAKYGTNRPLIV